MTRHPSVLRSVLTWLTLLTTTATLTGCAVVFRGPNQNIPVGSTPPGAEVILDGDVVGVTPVEIQVSRSGEHTLTVRFGEQEQDVILTPVASSVGSALLAVDIAPGGALVITGAVTPCEGEFLCEDLRPYIIGTGVVLAVIPLGIDLATGAYLDLSPSSVMVEFD